MFDSWGRHFFQAGAGFLIRWRSVLFFSPIEYDGFS